MVGRARVARENGVGVPGFWKIVTASNESCWLILSRSAMNIGRFDSAFAVEMETTQSAESSLRGSEDELAKTYSALGVRLFFAIFSILVDRSIPIEWSQISRAFSRKVPVPHPISTIILKCFSRIDSSTI